MKRSSVALIVLALGGLWYAFSAPTLLYRYRLRVDIDTPNGIKSGSSVIETRVLNQTAWLPDMPVIGTRVIGEAVFVDLGDGRSVIAILASGPTAMEDVDFRSAVPNALGIYGWGDVHKLKAALASAKGAGLPLALSRDAMPTVLTFKDQKDPRTTEVIFASKSIERQSGPQDLSGDPPWGNRAVAIDRFAEVFGQGYGLNTMSIDIVPEGIWPLNQLGLSFPEFLTGAPVTAEIRARLPGLEDQQHWNDVLNALPWNPDRLLAGSGVFIK
jgi:hypothetical protein